MDSKVIVFSRASDNFKESLDIWVSEVPASQADESHTLQLNTRARHGSGTPMCKSSGTNLWWDAKVKLPALVLRLEIVAT